MSCNVSTPDGPKWAAQSGKKKEGGLEVEEGKCASDVTSDGPKWTARSQRGCGGVNLGRGRFTASRRP